MEGKLSKEQLGIDIIYREGAISFFNSVAGSQVFARDQESEEVKSSVCHSQTKQRCANFEKYAYRALSALL